MNQFKEFSKMASNSNPSSKNLSPREFRRRNKILSKFEDTNEKKSPLVVSQASNKKILGDRNCNNTQLSDLCKTLLKTNPKNGKLSANSHEKNQSFEKVHPLSDSSPSAEYDPVTNYTSPRPAFLRYNPNRRKEILARMKDCEEESLSDENLLSSSSVSSKSKDDEKQFEDEVENEEEGYSSDYEESEIDDGKFWCSKNVWKWFVPFMILSVLNYYMFSNGKPLHEKNSSIQNLRDSRYNLKTHMGVEDVCFYIGNEMCDLVISDVVNDSDTWIIDENNKESAEGDESKEELSPSQEMRDLVILDVANDSDTWIIDENNKESAEGDESKEEVSPFQEMHDLVILNVANDSDTWIIDENNKELSSVEVHESNEELSPFQGNIVSSSNFSTGKYNIGIYIGVIQKCFNVGREMCDLAASDASTNNGFTTLGDHEPSGKKSVESMNDSPDIDQKLATDSQNEVAMNTNEFLMHEVSNESEEIGKDANMVYESDKVESSESFEYNSYEVRNKFGLLAIRFAMNRKLILFSGCMLSVMLALWIALSMCFSKSSKILKDSNVTSLSSESVEENDSTETKEEGKDSNYQSISISPKDENVEFHASRPPAVELLCEFSIVDDFKYSSKTSSKTKKMKESENSELSKSQGKENSQVSRPRKSIKTAMNSLPSNNGKANERQLKKEMMNLATPTPLRRSSRLQNRVTPPYLQNGATPPNL